jgi:hypothetical protein
MSQSIGRIGAFLCVLTIAVSSAHAVQIKAITCARQAVTKAKNVASGIENACRAEAGLRSSASGERKLYLVTLSADEARGGTHQAFSVARREVQRRNLCGSAVELVGGPEAVGKKGKTQLAVRCSKGKKKQPH